jgi:hypothetical protein
MKRPHTDNFSWSYGNVALVSGETNLDYKIKALKRFKYDPKEHLNSHRHRVFDKLVDKWHQDTQFSSSLTDIFDHHAYQKISNGGRFYGRLILQRLKNEPDYWFAALNRIYNVNPVPPEMMGDVEAMTQCWLDFAARNGLLANGRC